MRSKEWLSLSPWLERQGLAEQPPVMTSSENRNFFLSGFVLGALTMITAILALIVLG